MKWLTPLLALYILGLSLWPCADEALPLTGLEQAVLLPSPTTSEPDAARHHSPDQCTPFCTCACCSVIVTLSPSFGYTLAPAVTLIPVAVAAFRYIPLPGADPLVAFWQPPKRQV